MEWDALLLSRLQFAFTIGFHIIFPAFTIGLASFLAVLEGLWLFTKKPLFKNLFVEPNPVPAKYAMAKLGLIASPEVRLPLCELTEANRALLDKTLSAIAR